MNDNNFNITDYTILNDAATGIENNVNTSRDNLEVVKNDMNSIISPNVFSGPIATDTEGNWNIVYNDLQNNIASLALASSGLNNINANYQNTDSTNSSSISGV